MTPKQVIDHFKGENEAAQGLGRTVTCIRTWKRNKKIPVWSQLAIETKTGGKLKAAEK